MAAPLTQTERIERAYQAFRKRPTPELRRFLALMPSPDPDQGQYDREENIPAIERVLRERVAS